MSRRLEFAAPAGSASPRVAARRPHVRWAALAGLVAVYLSWQAFGWIPLRRELVGDGLLLAISLSATAAAWGAARRTAVSPRSASAWRCIALALLGQSAGQAVQLAYELSNSVAFPSWADPLYLSFYPLLLIGVFRFPVGTRTRRQIIELALDSAIVTLGGGAAFVYLVLGPDALAARTLPQAIVSIAYPVGDLVLLVALGSTLMVGAPRGSRSALRPLALAMALFALADLIYGYIAVHGSYHGGDPVDTLYALAFSCFAFAAGRQRPLSDSGDYLRLGAAWETHATWLPFAAIGAGAATVLGKELGQPFFPDLSIAIIVALIGLLVVLRASISQRNVQLSRTRLAQAQEIAQVGSWEWDVERDILERSEEDLRLHGLDPDTPPSTREESRQGIVPEDRDRVHSLLEEAIRDIKPFAFEMRIIRPDGERRTLLTRGEVDGHGGHARWVRGTHQDITDRKRLEVQLKYQADHDPLTGLLNRRRFAEELDRVLLHSARYRRPGALLMLDLDDFKILNDTRGHAAGDRALRALGEAIRERVRREDVVARLGGDEFAVVLPEVDERQALAVAEDIRRRVADRAPDVPIHVTCGLVAFNAPEGMSADDALIAADIALYEAKEHGKDCVETYHGSAGAAVTWVGRIRDALEQGRFVLYAQPMLDLRTRANAHSELLIRMIAEDGTVIAPGVFLPTAERFGLINEIDRWVTREGLGLAIDGQSVSINLSAQSIGDPEIVSLLSSALSAGLDPSKVIFEITESAAMRNMEEARTFAQALIDRGCQVALDDFGTGFGSFNYLKHLPARYLKIDMEFVREMIFNATDRQVVDAITRVAHSLGKLTIAEGVEDAATLQTLREYGVDMAQGYFIGRPLPIATPARAQHVTSARIGSPARVAKIGE